jgi:hypothetical protein
MSVPQQLRREQSMDAFREMFKKHFPKPLEWAAVELAFTGYLDSIEPAACTTTRFVLATILKGRGLQLPEEPYFKAAQPTTAVARAPATGAAVTSAEKDRSDKVLSRLAPAEDTHQRVRPAVTTTETTSASEEKLKASVAREARVALALRRVLESLADVDLSPAEKQELSRRFSGALGANGARGGLSFEGSDSRVAAAPAKGRHSKMDEERVQPPRPQKKIRGAEEDRLMREHASALLALKAAVRTAGGGRLSVDDPHVVAVQAASRALHSFRAKQKGTGSEEASVAPAGAPAARGAAGAPTTKTPEA